MSFTWTDTLTPGITQIKKAHIDELRSKYKAVESAVTFSPSVNMSFTDPTITAGEKPIRKVHIDELRVAVNNLESKFSNNCNCNNCCQTCQTCQSASCQSPYCQSCQGCQSCQSQSCQSQCTQCAHASCFIAGTMILMIDYTWKPIEQLAPGDQVFGLTGINTVLKTYQGPLGPSRCIITFPDHSLSCSGEHLYWIRTEDDEFFGAFDYGQYLFENSPILSPNLEGYYLNRRDAIHIYTPVEFAHLSGWKRWKPIIDHRYGDDTIVHAVFLNGDHTLIANGYLTGTFTHDDDFDYTGLHWNGLVIK